MSIATEITRLQTAKADLATAIEGKGVTVPSTAKLDGYADLVEQISGGGSGYTASEIASGNVSGDVVIDENISLIDFAFVGQKITSFNAPKITRCGVQCFAGCTSLTTIDLPALVEANTISLARMFSGCSALVRVNAPYIGYFAVYMFEGCSKLTSYTNKTTNNKSINTGMFRNNNALSVVDFTKLTGFANAWAWDGDTALTTIILRQTDSVVPVNNVNNVPPTIRNGGSGATIYVPSALIGSYKTATNWSTLDGYGTITWASIEGSVYETQYADGTPIT